MHGSSISLLCSWLRHSPAQRPDVFEATLLSSSFVISGHIGDSFLGRACWGQLPRQDSPPPGGYRVSGLPWDLGRKLSRITEAFVSAASLHTPIGRDTVSPLAFFRAAFDHVTWHSLQSSHCSVEQDFHCNLVRHSQLDLFLFSR